MTLSFDDPAPPRDVRKAVSIFMRPSLKQQVDAARGKMTRSEFIERALVVWFQRRKPWEERSQ